MDTNLSAADFKSLDLPRHKDELPSATVRLYLSVNNEPFSYKGVMESIATTISLRYGYPIWQEMTQRNPNWENVYCERVLDAAMRLVKQREKSQHHHPNVREPAHAMKKNHKHGWRKAK
jgi:hypothetical protein